MKSLVVAVLALGISLPALAKDHAAEYQVGTFSATGQLSDGSYTNCYGHGCSSYSAGHNIHYVRTNDGMYAIQAPVSVGKTMLLGMMTDGFSPTIHKEWFMDQLHEGDQVLFDAKCNKHNNCEFYLPDPDKTGKEFATIGFYRADVAKTNTNTLCGKGKLSPAVEAQVCRPPTRPAYSPITAPAPVPAPSTTSVPPVSQPVAPATTTAVNAQPAQVPPPPATNPNARCSKCTDKW